MKRAEVSEWVPLSECQRVPPVSGLYILRNRLTGLEYVGKAVDVRRRLYKHRKPEHFRVYLTRAIRDNGVENFEVMLYLVEEHEPTLLELEMLLIAERGTLFPKGYNLTAGGEGSRGFRMPAESIARMVAKNTGKKRDPAAVAATAAANRGQKRSEETREKLRVLNAGKKMSDETRAKMSTSRKGRTVPEEDRKALSEKHKRNPRVQQNMKEIAARRRRPVLVWRPGSMTPLEFDSATAAAAYFSTDTSQVSAYCLGLVRPRCGTVYCYL